MSEDVGARLSWMVNDELDPPWTAVGDTVMLWTASGWTSSAPLVATPLNVTVIVSVRGVGTSTVVTLNDADDPVSDTLVGHVSPWPTHATVAVCVDGSAAESDTVTGTDDGDTVDAGFAVTLVTVGGATVIVADRDCPPDVAVMVTVRDAGTTCVAI